MSATQVMPELSTQACTPTRALLRRLVASALAPPERLTVSQWADRYRRIKGAGSAEAGDWSTERVPYLRDIMDAYSDPRVRRIVVMKREQVGVTEATMNMFLYTVATSPCPMFWVWSNEENARDFNQKRLFPTMQACPVVAAKMSGRKSDSRSLDITLPDGSVLWLRGAPPGEQGVRKLESHAARVIFNDELNRCDASTPDVMLGRSTTFPRTYKHVFVSTPSDWGAGIHNLYGETAGGGLRYWVPCPLCGVYFVRDFSGVRWLPGQGVGAGILDADPDVVRVQAWYECPHCRGAIAAAHSRPMLRRGVWAPDWNEDVPARENQLPPQERIDEALHAPSVGFWIGEFENAFQDNPYGEIAAEYVRNGGQETSQWTTRRRGRPWRVAGESLKTHELLKLCRPVVSGGYRFDQAPASTAVLLGAMDVQADRVYAVVQGFTPGMRRSWLVWAGCVMFTRPGGILANADVVRGVVERTFAVEQRDGAGGGRMRAVGWAVDSGYSTADVYAVCRKLGGKARRVYPFKGRAGSPLNFGRDGGFTVKGLDEDASGRPAPVDRQSLMLVSVDTWAYKSFLLERIKAAQAVWSGRAVAADSVGAGGASGDGSIGDDRDWSGVVLGFPEAATEQGVARTQTSYERLRVFFESVTSEERRLVLDKRTGRRQYAWCVRDGTAAIGNHYLDCWVYVHALARLLKVPSIPPGRRMGVVGPDDIMGAVAAAVDVAAGDRATARGDGRGGDRREREGRRSDGQGGGGGAGRFWRKRRQE